MSQNLNVLFDQGSGRPYVIVIDDSYYSTNASEIADFLSKKSRVVTIQSVSINDDNWEELSLNLQELLVASKIRQASFISFGSAATLVKNLSLHEPKLARTITLVNATSRAHPTPFSRFIDWIERFLPLGLPLRLPSKGFDSRAFLHRLRCPILAVSTGDANGFLLGEAELIENSLPTSWRVNLPDVRGASDAEKLCEILQDFQMIPAKCPQKNL